MGERGGSDGVAGWEEQHLAGACEGGEGKRERERKSSGNGAAVLGRPGKRPPVGGGDGWGGDRRHRADEEWGVHKGHRADGGRGGDGGHRAGGYGGYRENPADRGTGRV